MKRYKLHVSPEEAKVLMPDGILDIEEIEKFLFGALNKQQKIPFWTKATLEDDPNPEFSSKIITFELDD